MSNQAPTVTIIGTGLLGTALLHYFSESSFEVRSHFNSKGGEIQTGSTKKNVATTLPRDGSEIGDWVFITTPDDAISGISKKLSRIDTSWNQKFVIHCSGALFSDELIALADKGAGVAAMHPIQSFNRGDGKERFRGIFITIEGDPEPVNSLKELIKMMGAHPVPASRSQKRDLHIAAVIVSNYTVALMHSAESLLEKSGLENGLKMVEPLVRQTINNIFEKGTFSALTGPVSRGDLETVSTHLQSLSGDKRDMLYRIMGLEATALASKAGRLSEQQAKSLKKLFTAGGSS